MQKYLILKHDFFYYFLIMFYTSLIRNCKVFFQERKIIWFNQFIMKQRKMYVIHCAYLYVK